MGGACKTLASWVPIIQMKMRDAMMDVIMDGSHYLKGVAG